MSNLQTIQYVIFAIIGGCVIGLFATCLTNYPITTLWAVLVSVAITITLLKDKSKNMR